MRVLGKKSTLVVSVVTSSVSGHSKKRAGMLPWARNDLIIYDILLYYCIKYMLRKDSEMISSVSQKGFIQSDWQETKQVQC